MSSAIPDSSASRVADPARRTFTDDLKFSLLFFIEPANAVTFLAIWFTNVVVLLILAACLAGLAIGGAIFIGARVLPVGLLFIDILLFGFVLAMHMRIVAETAEGEDILPLTTDQGFFADFVSPLVAMAAIIFVIFVPTLFLTILASRMDFPIPHAFVIANAVVGVTLFPIMMLAVTIGGLSALLRIDAIVMTVYRTFSVYVLVWLFMLVVSAGTFALIKFLLFPPAPGAAKLATAHPVPVLLVVSLIVSYFFVVAMRVIGLYYRHFKHQFAWSWE